MRQQSQANAPSVAPTSGPEEIVEAPPQLPIGSRGYFACRSCRRVLTEPQWYSEGCLDCSTGPIQRGEIMEYATSHFSNFIGLIAPEKSWVARLIGKTRTPNGIFAAAFSDDDGDDATDDEDEADNMDGGFEEPEEGRPSDSRTAPSVMPDEEVLGL